MKLDHALEPFSIRLMSEMVPLILRHFQEISRFKHLTVEPDFERYENLQKSGMLRIFTARHDGELIGYSVFTVLNHPHFKSSRQAHEELLYLDPLFRKGNAGERFIKFCDRSLEGDKVEIVFHTVSAERDYSLLLVRMGYSLVDRIYARRLV